MYIHYPFCASKCPYCDFNSYVNLGIDEDLLLAGYLDEIKYYANIMPDFKLHSIFFGGGTPSLMSPKFLDVIMEEIFRLYDVAEDIEISMEANPTTFDLAKMQDFRRSGINRLSIGVQSLDDRDLHFLGRTHSAAEALEAIGIAAKVFGDRYSIDLIYALPGQNPESWRRELARAISLSPNHLSLYQLIVEDGTPFHNRAILGADEELAAELYEITREITEDGGMPFYEVSNYARPNHRSQHNINYWKSGQWIGIGAGAHGRLGVDGNFPRRSIENFKNPNEWLAAVKNKGLGAEIEENLTEKDFILEFLMMGLRLRDGVTSGDLQKTLPNRSLADIVNINGAKMLRDNNFIEFSENHIRVRPDKFLLLESIIEKLI